uniref:mannitol 2-dehydrogenase n=1 Tax=Aplanochytrium stocchinoi TaxID=215587 RepID=A0A7S3PI73_9STRA|mmetsp:Transcript_18186/g.22435  ORF Transcript_18186/g.22435 Transcript_18186/m.22435 type:complete len:525 (+) Transcript_18186:73-1647(+)
MQVKSMDSVKKLSMKTLQSISAHLAIPEYDRSSCGQSILHLGIGGFHRAHLAYYIHQLLQRDGSSEWGIFGTGLGFPSDRKMKEALSSQDFLYTLVELGADRAGNTESNIGNSEMKAYVVGSILGMEIACDNLQEILARIASKTTKIISLTITEGGYYYNSVTGKFMIEDEQIQKDLSTPESPSTAIGLLVEGLRKRMITNNSQSKVTLLSCDNLPGNGNVLRTVIEGYTKALDNGNTLYAWIKENVSFPNSMVDRITPVTSDLLIQKLRESYFVDDVWPVNTEPFVQWVVEDNFAAGRPQLERVGVQFVNDVLPYEHMKMELLNASHSLMGYLGFLAGFKYIHEVALDDEYRAIVLHYMNREVTPVLEPVPGIDIEQYKNSLMVRFQNSRIKDTLVRICLGGSSKLPKFLLPVVRKQIAAGGDFTVAALLVAAWFRYLLGVDENGHSYEVDDPMAEALHCTAKQAGTSPDLFFEYGDLFAPDVVNSDAFRNRVTFFLQSLHRLGSRTTVHNLIIKEKIRIDVI